MEFDIFRFVATDNLPNRSGARIPLDGLRVLRVTMIGVPATLDHGWGGVRLNFGRVVDSDLISLPAPSGLRDWELESISSEGYHQLILSIAIQNGHPQIPELESYRQGEVSISFIYDALKCPGCTCGSDIWDCERRNFKYVERHAVNDGLEISLVISPAVKRARLIVE